MPGATHRAITQATVPVSEEPVPEKEVVDCPKCRSKRNVRQLSKANGLLTLYCTGCDLEFRHYTACEGWELDLDDGQLRDLMRLWKSGAHLGHIAEKLKLHPDNAAVIILSMASQGLLRKRLGGALGSPKEFPAGLREEFGGM